MEDNLDKVIFNRKILDKLYFYEYIDTDEYKKIMSILYPSNNWALWISRILLFVGVSFILAGIVFFFAYNWDDMSGMFKLGVIQSSVIMGVICSYCFWDRKPLLGRLFLIATSLIVGVFMAVFGQVYQTGANAYQLFVTWSLLIFGWTVISNFAAQWIFWLVVTNVAISLWWGQSVQPSRAYEELILTFLTLFNGSFLLLREYMVIKKQQNWLEYSWVRSVILIAVVITAVVPVSGNIFDFKHYHQPLTWVYIVTNLLILSVLYWLYRYKIPNIKALSVVIFGLAVIAYSALSLFLAKVSLAISYLIGGILAVAVFGVAIAYIRHVSKEIEGANDR